MAKAFFWKGKRKCRILSNLTWLLSALTLSLYADTPINILYTNHNLLILVELTPQLTYFPRIFTAVNKVIKDIINNNGKAIHICKVRIFKKEPNFFSNIGSDISRQIPKHYHVSNSFCTGSCAPPINTTLPYLTPTINCEVAKIIQNLNTYTSSRIDRINVNH